jgi:hypothetical protein
MISLLIVSCTFARRDHATKAYIADKSPEILETIPAKYREAVRLSLYEAGENAPELIKVMATLKDRELEWACFVIGTMPLPDLISIKSDYLLEHIHYTSLAKDRYKWIQQIPGDIFLAYVLPYRMSSEPIVSHRKYFFEQLDPLLKDCTDIFEASYQVNLWLGGERKGAKARVHFEPGEARNKSPFGVLLSGQGRCGELTIALIAAARAVGIPARSVSTPSWVKREDNHGWTEIWADGRWYAIASGEPSIQSALAATAGRTWFTEAAATAAALYSERFGVPEDQSSVYRASKKDSVINVLPNYSQTCKLDIIVLAPDGKAAPGTPVSCSVVNSGVFRKVALQKTDAHGKATIKTGIGQYMLSAGDGDSFAWQLISTTPATLPVTLTLARGDAPFPSGYFTLRFPSTHDAYMAFNPTAALPSDDLQIPEAYLGISPEHSSTGPPEKFYHDRFSPEEHPEIKALIDHSPLFSDVVRAMELAGGNWPELAAAIKEVPEEQREDLLWLISTLNQVDGVESTKEILLEHVSYARLSRKNLPVQIPDDIYRSYVLSLHFPYMHIYQWRRGLYDMFEAVVAEEGRPQNIADMALRINQWIEENVKLMEPSSGRFMTAANPFAVFTSKRAMTSGPTVATAAALRSVGIPAKVKSTWVEFYDGTDWKPLYPMNSENLGKTEATETSRQEYAKKGGVRAITTKNGFAFSPDEPNWGVARFNDGGWDYLKSESSNGWASVTPGKYLFTAAARNANGDVLIYARPMMITSNRGMELTVPLDLPVEMLSTEERLVRKLDNTPDFVLQDKNGKSYNFRQILLDKNILLVLFTLESETSIKMLYSIQSLVDTAASKDVTILAILINRKGMIDKRLKHINVPVLLDKDMLVAGQFIPDVTAINRDIPPSILLFNRNGELLLWKEGYNLAVNHMIIDAFNTLLGKMSATPTLEALDTQVKLREVDLVGLDKKGP